MEEQDTIDLGQVLRVAKDNRFKLIAIIILSTLVALGIAFLLPERYESSVLVRTKNQQQNGISLQASAAMALLGASSAASPLKTYQELLTSRSVLDPIIGQLDLPDKEKITNEAFAKKYLDFDNPKGTDVLKIKATGRTPEEAQWIASNVVSSFQQLLTNLNQSDQSLQMKFLSERLNVAKKEMEQAERNLEQFRQQSKVYVPDEQAKAAVEKMTVLDQKLAELTVNNEATRASLQSVNEQLYQQNAAMKEYNLADNPVVEKIRTSIVDKQVELVSLQQRYTDKHPSVILAKKEIDDLTEQLRQEIAKSIESGANVLSPVQGNLLQAKITAETGGITTQASIDAMKRLQAQSEQEISNLSANSLTYVGLERQARITQEVYTVLVKNYEQARIQEAMESMDIQIVDEANLPKGPSFPKKLLLTAIGGIVGVLVSFVYLIVLYRRRSSETGLSL